MASLDFLSRINEVFVQDPLIDEFGFILGDVEKKESEELTEDDLNRFYIIENHKLGIMIWALPYILKQAKREFYNQRLNYIKNNHNISLEKIHDLINVTRVVLLINADCYTAWNIRKFLVTKGILKEFNEIQLCNLIFTKHPKSIDTWAYRNWLKQRIFRMFDLEMIENLSLKQFLQNELLICTTLTEQYPRNYHAWKYRREICDQMDLNMILQELEVSNDWTSRHLKDHSSWSYRHYLISRILDLSSSELNYSFFEKEFHMIQNHLILYSNHEALWCYYRTLYKRFLMQINIKEKSHLIVHILNFLLSRKGEKMQECNILEGIYQLNIEEIVEWEKYIYLIYIQLDFVNKMMNRDNLEQSKVVKDHGHRWIVSYFDEILTFPKKDSSHDKLKQLYIHSCEYLVNGSTVHNKLWKDKLLFVSQQ